MPMLPSRTMPLLASSILFVSFLFATVDLGEGLKCYACFSEPGGNCTTLMNALTVECSATPKPTQTPTTVPPTTVPPTTVPPTTQQDILSETSFFKGGESLFEFSQQASDLEREGDVCYYASITISKNGTEQSTVVRGCGTHNNLGCVIYSSEITIKSLEYTTCSDSDYCNSSGGIQIGVVSLFLPLIASLLVTR